MARQDRFLAPEVCDAVPIETEISNLRREITMDCAKLLVQAIRVNERARGNFNLKLWEGRISDIREAQLATYSIRDLGLLKAQCGIMSRRLAEFHRA